MLPDNLLSGQTDTLFPWLGGSGTLAERLTVGGLLFLIGLLGALVTVYFSRPGELPRIGGGLAIRELRLAVADAKEVVEARRRTLNRVAEREVSEDTKSLYEYHKQLFSDAVADLDQALARLNEQMRLTLRYRAPIFVLLGGCVALLFSLNLLQALVLGASWPLILSGLGIHRQLDVIAEAAAREARDAVNAEIAEVQRETAATVTQAERQRELALQGERKAILALHRALRRVPPNTPDREADSNGE